MKVAAGVGNAVRLYDPKSREELGCFTAEMPETLSFNSTAFSPDATKVAAGGGKGYPGHITSKAKNNTDFV